MSTAAQMGAEQEVEEIVNRETRAWDTQDLDLLMTLFHPDMVWVWPRTSRSHDPLDWETPLGRFDYQRWREGWRRIFATHELVHNRRELLKVVVSEQGDGAFAVVDVDTLWRNRATGADFHWKGRACKVYTRMPEGWKMISHAGLLEYSG